MQLTRFELRIYVVFSWIIRYFHLISSHSLSYHFVIFGMWDLETIQDP